MAEPQRRAAIIDIGSNSVRLVVYAGPARAPQPIFNEKLMAGLGSELATTGRIDQRAYDRALAGLARFGQLTAAMGIDDVRCVATAAVRDAENGAEFIADARAMGQAVELLSGRDEARASGYGVLSAIPDADGIVADMGGGSLELVRVRNGKTMHHSSFPLGVLRLGAVQAAHGKGFGRYIGTLLRDAGWPGEDTGLPLYLVGGSWRALARYEMMLARDPMPVLAGHSIPVDAVPKLHRRLRKLGTAELSGLQGLSSARVETIPAAAAILVPLVEHLASKMLIVTTSGLREGLLFQDLPDAVRVQDPLIVAAAAEGQRFARFDPNGGAIDAWISPIFADDSPAMARLRLAACLLSDVATTANPDFRTERAAEMALHGQWLGIEPDERRVMAQALYTSVGGQGRVDQAVSANRMVRKAARGGKVDGKGSALDRDFVRATEWGLAMRLAQRLSGGVASLLGETRIERRADTLTLRLPADRAQLGGEQALRRFNQLAAAVGLNPVVRDAR